MVMEELEYIEIPLHGKLGKGKVTLVDGDYDGEYFSQYRWYLLPNGYVARANIENRTSGGKDGYIYLHQLVCKTSPGRVVDHIDRNKLNNRSYNLRQTTYKGNASNRRQPKQRQKALEKDRFRGVSVRKNLKVKKYVASIKGRTLGYFSEPEQAAKAYDEAAKKLYGKDAITNYR